MKWKFGFFLRSDIVCVFAKRWPQPEARDCIRTRDDPSFQCRDDGGQQQPDLKGALFPVCPEGRG